MQPTSYFNIFYYLLVTDFQIFKRTVVDKCVNLLIWVFGYTLVSTYLIPAFGADHEYASFMIAGLAASAGLFEIFPSVAMFINDRESNNVISFYLTLPVPSWLILVRNIVFYAFNACTIGIFVLPFCKLLVWNKFNVSNFNPFAWLLIFILTNIFYATFTLWIISRVPRMEKIGNVWMRFVYPYWFLGGFNHAWYTLYSYYPTLAYLSFLNPVTYIMEGNRAAILGQHGYLNYWLCAFMLLLFSILCGWHAITSLKKKLDFV